MPDYIDFTEGQNAVLEGAVKQGNTIYFLLSTSAAGSFTAATTLAGGVGEITGTGAGRKSQAAPASANGQKAFTQMSWATGAAADWPAAVRSVVMVTSADNSGKAICAWNLLPGGTARDMSQPNTTENVTPTFGLT